MGIEVKGRHTGISAQHAVSILTQHTERLGTFIDLDRVLDYQAYYQLMRRPYMEQWNLYMKGYRTKNGQLLKPSQKDEVKTMFQQYLEIPREKLKLNDYEDKASTDKRVITALIDDPEIDDSVKDVLRVYQKICDYSQRISYMKQYVGLPILTEKSFDGHRMVLARPTWSELATGRISAKAPSIQNIYRDFADLATYPKDWILLRTDSGQIEPRITYSVYVNDVVLKNLIIAYNDAYYGQLDFITMDERERDYFYKHPDEIVAKPLLKADEFEIAVNRDVTDKAKLDGIYDKLAIVPEIKHKFAQGDYDLQENWLKGKVLVASDRQLLKKLGLAGNYGSANLDAMSGTLAANYNRYIVNHPDRLRLAQEVEDYVDHGGETFITYFGTEITPDDEGKKYKRGTPAWRNHLIRCGINNPIQGTAGDLMNLSVYTADQLISKYAKGPTGISYYKHDEGAFTIAPQDKDLAKELEEVTSYFVEGWIPIYADPEYGKKHGVEGVPEIQL